MSGAVFDGSAAPLSFSNSFWGKNDAGVGPILERMYHSKTSCDELKTFYSLRAAIEDEYARKLSALCRKPLGSGEAGSLRDSFDTVRGETECIARAHSVIASQIKRELEEPLVAFAGGTKERRKIIQNGIERLHKAKVQQTQIVNKARDRYEQDCLRIKGYLAQGHMVMGQEERKNKAKLEKTQIQLAASSSEYESVIKVLEDTTTRWNKEWKSACDKFQELEEERLDFTKSSLWQYANIASTVCVSDDASCEKIHLSLENCEVEKDILSFIKEKGTGQEIPEPPKFVKFHEDDANDTNSEEPEDGSYSAAQFQRPIYPAFRSSSPQPSTYESHHDPQPENTKSAPNVRPSSSRGHAITPPKPLQHPTSQQSPDPQPQPLDLRRGGQLPPNYDPSQHGEINSVPHNSYPTDGMTMFCRAGPPSERSSAASGQRPPSRDSQSECSNPTSMSSQEPLNNATASPTKPVNGIALPGMGDNERQVQKKRSAFFSNSPFRRKSRHDKNSHSSSPRGSWGAHSKQASLLKTPNAQRHIADTSHLSGSPEPADPRANFQLNIGNNVFDVASPDQESRKNSLRAENAEDENSDPIVRALADLKVAGKQPSSRVSADRYHGIASPAPSAPEPSYASQVATPPPAYNDPSIKRLGAPQPAFTSAQMQKTTQKYAGQTQHMLRGPANGGGMAAKKAEQAQDTSRAKSPALRRSASPQVSPKIDTRMGQYGRGASPSSPSYQSNSTRSRYAQSPKASSPQHTSDVPFSPCEYPGHVLPGTLPRAISPQPQFRRQSRPSSAGGMELQLSDSPVVMYGGHDGHGVKALASGRPTSYHNGISHGGRPRSRTLAVAEPGRHYSRDGRPILHFARAIYSYTAAIPEELGFTKGDVLAVIRLQDDGWWEAEVTTTRGGPGLVPSNYLQVI